MREAKEFVASADRAERYLTAAQILILEAMGQDGGRTPGEVAVALGLASSTVHEQLARVRRTLNTRHWFASFLRFQAHRRIAELTEPRPPPKSADPAARAHRRARA